MMIQEQRNSEYHFIRGEYVRIKIKMQPQSLMLDVPLDWQINKIKCLLIKIMIKLQFDMFTFHHDNQEIPGDMTLRTVIEQDKDYQCIKGDHYVLNFVKLDNKSQQFQRYYLNKMRPLVKSLENSPFQPILHPGYYNMKYLNHINRIPFQGGKELIINFNQLQQMQNVLHQHRRQNQNQNQEENFAGFGNMVGVNNNGGNWLTNWLIRIIQLISLFTIARFLLYNSSIEVFISIAFLSITYFTIEYLKKKNRFPQNQTQKVEPTQNIKSDISQSTIFERVYYTFIIFLVEKICLVLECILSLGLSLFPNWTVESHQDWFKGINNSIELKLNQWKNKIISCEDEVKEKNQASTQQPSENYQFRQEEHANEENNENMHKIHDQ